MANLLTLLKLFITESLNDNMEEMELLTTFKQGSEEAFVRIYERYYRSLINFARKKTNSLYVSEDLVQDVFLHLYTHRSIELNIEGYLFTALRRKIYNYWRHEMVHSNYQAKIEYTATPLEKDASTILELKELQADFEKQINDLPPQCQKIFRLRREHHLSNNDIAEHLGITVKAVESQITKAIKILRTHFEYYSLAGLLLTLYELLS